MRRFFKALLPATIGSAGTQLALFADTIIASLLATGAISALYYADRIDQLPIGVIGIAVGTVLLPEMTHKIAGGDDPGARSAQNRAIEFALLLAIPCIVAFLVVPDVIMRGLFLRGRFTAGDAHAAAMTLMAYTVGLIPFVLIRSVAAPFLARGDTSTPMKAALIGTAVNIGCKVAADGSAGASRSCAGDVDWRLDQFYSGVVAGGPRRPFCRRCRAQVLARQARRRRHLACRPLLRRSGRARSFVLAEIPLRIGTARIGHRLVSRLWWARAGAVRTAMAFADAPAARKAPAAPIEAFEGTTPAPPGPDDV